MFLCLATYNRTDYNGLNKQGVYFSYLSRCLDIGGPELVSRFLHVIITLGCFYWSAPPSFVCGFHLYECTAKHSVCILGKKKGSVCTTKHSICILGKKKGKVEFKRDMPGEFSRGKQTSQPKNFPLLLH